MANHKSALKRVKQNEKRRLRNKVVKTKIKNILKSTKLAADENEKEKALNELITVQGTLDKAVKKGVLHKNTASRTVSRLTKMVNNISA